MFGVVPKQIWSKLQSADEKNLCNWALRCLLIEDGNKLILVDTGVGDKQDERFFGHYYLSGTETLESSLKKAGFGFSDITDVILTHLHFDHCGGAIKREGEKLVPTFSNAVYWSNEKHWQWATEPNEREKASFLKENILPVAASGQLQMIDVPENGIAGFSGDIKLRFVNGHTDSMMLPQISFNGRTIVYMADLLPSVSHIPLPYIMAYDMFPLTTLAEKKSFLTEALENNYTLFFEHDAVHECCNLQLTEKGIRQRETFDLTNLR